MFNVNDYVVYGLNGVCQIVFIGKDEYSKYDETEYYVLHPVDNNNLTIRVPVKKDNTTMRAICTKDHALSLIAMLPELHTVWIDDERQRTHNYKDTLKTGNTEDLVKLVKTLYLEKEARSQTGKKLTKTDEEIFNAAEKHLYEEFAVALNISSDDVVSYIREHIPRNVQPVI